MPGLFLTRSVCPEKGHVDLATMIVGQISGTMQLYRHQTALVSTLCTSTEIAF